MNILHLHNVINQICTVQKSNVVAVLGKTGNLVDSPCELWFFVASKKSHAHDAYIHGRWLHEISKDTTNVNEFEIHSDEEEIEIAKATVIDCGHGFTEHDGVYSIHQSEIDGLQCIVSYEDDSVSQIGKNSSIIMDLQTAASPLSGAALLQALSRAESWKEKVSDPSLSTYYIFIIHFMNERI